jgi:hypothetical protein
VIEADPDEVKKYKSYLTRFSKWLAVHSSSKPKASNLITEAILRSLVVGRGELKSFCDETWSKKVLGDQNIFEPNGEGWWKIVVDEEKGPSRPKWEGIRPTDDVYGDALIRATEAFVQLPVTPNAKAQWLDTDSWAPAHRCMTSAMEYAKSRGSERPLIPLQELAFHRSLVSDEPYLQLVALWLTNTRRLLEAFNRLQAVKKGEAEMDQGDLYFLRRPGQEPSYQSASAFVRHLLLERGILGGNKG